MKNYFERLKDHPGVSVAFMMTILGALAGMSNKSIEIWWHGALFGSSIGALCWIAVLISNIEWKR